MEKWINRWLMSTNELDKGKKRILVSTTFHEDLSHWDLMATPLHWTPLQPLEAFFYSEKVKTSADRKIWTNLIWVKACTVFFERVRFLYESRTWNDFTSTMCVRMESYLCKATWFFFVEYELVFEACI